jgi:hypothetical protein
MTGWTTRVRFPAGALKGCFLFAIAYRPVLGPTQLPIQGVLGVKRLGLEPDHIPPPSAKVKNAKNYTSTPSVRLHSVVLN